MLYLSCKVARDSTTTTTNEQRQRQQQQQQRRQLGSNCFYTMPGLCSTDAVEFFRIVRIVYVKPSTSPVSDNNIELPSVIYPINYETFIPDLVQRLQNASPSISSSSSSSTGLHVDKMKDTFAKVIAFLHQSGMYILPRSSSSLFLTIILISQSFSLPLRAQNFIFSINPSVHSSPTFSPISQLSVILASCLINAQPLAAHRPAADDNSLIGCTGHDLTDDWSLASTHFVDSLCPFRCSFGCVLLLNQMF